MTPSPSDPSFAPDAADASRPSDLSAAAESSGAFDANGPSGAAVDQNRLLLRLLCCIAWSDGAVSSQERELLERLATQVLLSEQEKAAAAAEVRSLVEGTLDLPALEALIPRIEGHDRRQLALKLAFMVIRVSGDSEASSPINAREKRAYRRLVDGLGLSDADVQEAEWAGEQELQQHNSLWSLLAARLTAQGAWPDSTLLGSPELPRL